MNNEPINQEEAAASLKDIEKIMSLTRRIIAQGSIARSLILWGVVWIIGYGAAPFARDFALDLWLGLIACGWIGTWVIHLIYPSAVRNESSRHNWKISAFWLILFLYSYIWAYLLVGSLPRHHLPLSEWSVQYTRMSAYTGTIAMFAYIVIGLWFSRFFIWLGGIVTVLALLGYLFLFDYFNFWMAICGGGSLVIAGMFIQKFWK